MGYIESNNYLARALNKMFPERKNIYIYLDDVIVVHNGTFSQALGDIIDVLSKLRVLSMYQCTDRK